MKIALVIYDSLETISGGYLYDRKLVENLRREGDTVEIISLPWRGYFRNLFDNFSPWMHQRLHTLEADILLQDELNHPSLFWLNRRFEAPPARVAIVHHLRVSEQRPAWQNALYAQIERRYLNSVDGFIFNSRTTALAVKSVVSDEFRIPQLIALPAGDRFKPSITEAEIGKRARSPGPLRLVFVGNLIPRKGLHTLLQVMMLLPAGTAELVVIGSPTPNPGYARRMQHIARQPALAACVRFLGALDDAALAAQLNHGHLLIVPSSYEGYGIAYLEGMSYGLPAIGCKAGAAGEIITDGQDGFLVPTEDASALAAIITTLASERARLLQLSLAARQRFKTQPSWEQSSEQIRNFLYEILLHPLPRREKDRR